jgi:signal transduction histidine kinase
MDPDSDNLGKVFTYVRDFGEELFENTDIEFLAENLIDDSDDIPLPSGWSRQIVLIFKEAMTNALKHSLASEALLKLEPIGGSFVLIFRDNGCGLSGNVKKGYGLKNMRGRAEQIGCRLTIGKTTGGEGTEVCFEGKIRNNKKRRKVKKYFNKTTTS